MQRIIEAQNDRPLSDFCGLSPNQMGQLLYSALDGEFVQFNRQPSSLPDCRALHLFRALLRALAENPAKATATGCLPLKLSKALAAEHGEDDEAVAGGLLGGMRSESDFFELQGIRVAAGYCGLLRKYKGQFTLTKRTLKLMAQDDWSSLYVDLVLANATKLNWAFVDRYPEAPFIQQSFAYTLFLLSSYGHQPRPAEFYAERFFTAFPAALRDFDDSPYPSPHDWAQRCYILRALQRFAGFFGLAHIEIGQGYPERPLTVRKTAWLDDFVSFKI